MSNDMTLTDQEMQLLTVIRGAVESATDYSACAEAMVVAATEAFDHVVRQVGGTNFQTSWAELEFVRRNRGLTGPCGWWTANDWLYPQYVGAEKRLAKVRHHPDAVMWLGDCAEYALASKGDVHPDVKAHWESLVADRDALDHS